MGSWNGTLLIDDSTPADVTHDPRFSRGLIPRDYAEHPEGMFAPPSQIKLIPRSEWDARIEEQEATQSSLSHVRMRSGPGGGKIPCLDQDGYGYCWAHSTTHAVMLARAAAGLPYVPLSAFAVAATLKQGRDEGGWCGLSAKFARERGVPSQEAWPQHDAKYRTHDTPATWESAAAHKITGDWVDLSKAVYDENLTFDMLGTLLLMNVPCPVDFNWQGHSVCAMRLVLVEAGSYGVEILNSWYLAPGQEWNGNGTAVYRGRKAIPDSSLGIWGTTATAA